jgi:hypothetical protein
MSGEDEGGCLSGEVVGQVDAIDPAASRVATGDRLEMEPGLRARMTDSLEATAAFRTGDRREPAVSNGEDRSKLWIGRVEHVRVLGTSIGVQPWGQPGSVAP